MNKINSNIAWNWDNSYVGLPKYFYKKTKPSHVKSPNILIINHSLAKSLNLNFEYVDQHVLSQTLCGNFISDGSEPISQVYAGHQFGHFTCLGDGRAHLLGEHINNKRDRFDIQLKGSGKTPFSRNGDGRAALGPIIREYIISEAMYNLGISTTRSLAVVTTGELVYRQTIQKGAILTRVSRSHIRIGTFEHFAAQGNIEALKILFNYTVKRHYSHLERKKHIHAELFKAVITKQINLVIDWMRVGFIHGVMNTDNVSISGETIDYGPCAFLDEYDKNKVFSSIDYKGRYAFGNQGKIMQWNLARFAECLLMIALPEEMDCIKQLLDNIAELFQKCWSSMMRKKLGLLDVVDSDFSLATELLEWMQSSHMDYTNTFLDLHNVNITNDRPYQDLKFQCWWKKWRQRISTSDHSFDESLKTMTLNNPMVIPRNHQVQDIINLSENGDRDKLHQFMDALSSPYHLDKKYSLYQVPPTLKQKIKNTFCGT